MKFALNENSVFQCDFIEFIKVSAAAGFSAVEISLAKVHEALRFISSEELLDCIDSAAISILSLNAFEDVLLVPESSLKLIENEARLLSVICGLVRCPSVIIPSSRWYSKYGSLPGKDEITSMYQKRLNLIKQRFDEHDVEVLFEPIDYPDFFVGTVDWTNEVLDTPELNALRLVTDVHNLNINGDGPEQLLKLNNPIGLFHLNDTLDLEKEKIHVASSRTFPGEGIASTAQWVKCAEKSGYSGYYSLELFDENIYSMEPGEAALLCRRKLESFRAICE